MEDKKVEIKATKKKRSLFQSEDFEKAKGYLVEKAISDATGALMTFGFNMIDVLGSTAKGLLRNIIFGNTPNNTSQININQNNSNTNYGKFWKQSINTDYTRTKTPTIFNRNIYDYETIEFESESMADYCLNRLKYYISVRGYVTVGQMYQEANLPYSNVDLKWGWTNLNNVVIQRNLRNKWILIMPKALEIE